jgi:hypothetical protein
VVTGWAGVRLSVLLTVLNSDVGVAYRFDNPKSKAAIEARAWELWDFEKYRTGSVPRSNFSNRPTAKGR